MQMHALWFRIFNINRIASHANKFYQLYRIIGTPENFKGSAWSDYSGFWATARQSLFQATINNCAMIEDNETRGHNLTGILDELLALNAYPNVRLVEFKTELATEAKPIAKRVTLIRNTVFAHRSQQLSYRKAMERANLTNDELGKLIGIYLRITDELNVKVTGKQPWSEADKDAGDNLLALLTRLGEP